MSMALQIIGALAILAIACALAFEFWLGILEVRERRSQRIRAQALTAAHREIGQYIVACAYWFEDRKACEAVKAIGEHMNDWGLIDCNAVREAWRKACAPAPSGAAPKGLADV
jgi:hypothetical protein